MRKFILSIAFSGVAFVPMVSMADGHAGVQCETVTPSIASIRENMHSNYMPNFIPVLANSQEALGLSGEQCAKINDFRKNKASKGKLLLKKIIKLEGEARKAAFDGASMDEILQRNDEIQALRTKVVKGKMNCHQFVKGLLTEQQYLDLKELMKKKRAEVMAKIADK